MNRVCTKEEKKKSIGGDAESVKHHLALRPPPPLNGTAGHGSAPSRAGIVSQMQRADDRSEALTFNRAVVCGRGEEILILVAAESSPAQLTDWLKLPLELSPVDAAFLLEPNQCCQYRRKGEELLALVMARASDEQWCKWLQVPLAYALIAGKTLLVQPLLAAGAGLAGPFVRVDNLRKAAAAAAAACSLSASASCCPAPVAGEIDAHGAAAVAADAVRPTASCCPSPRPSPRSCCGVPRSALPMVSPTVSSCCPSPVAVTVTGCGGRKAPVISQAPRASSSSSSMSSSPSSAVSSFTASAAAASSSTLAASSPLPCISSGGGAGGGGGGGAVVAPDLSLHRATMAQDSARMLELLASGVDRDAKDLWGCTALHRAAEQAEQEDGSAEPVRILLAAGLDVRAKDMEGYTPLHFAAARGAETAIVDLLAAGSCLAERGINGDTPLHSAVRFLSLATVRILLEADADEAAQNGDGLTPREVTGVLPDGRDIENAPDPLMGERIAALLDEAPSRRRTRVWKRRGWIVLLRARAQAKVARELAEAARTGCRVVIRQEGIPAECCGGGEGSDVGDCGVRSDRVLEEECGGGGGGGGGSVGGGVVRDDAFSVLVEQTTLLPEEGLFQKVVQFL